jgi:eukaryotic-like serine/threonine-protein kinase
LTLLAPGARLGPYEITAHVGDGGMGEVYRARDTRLDRIVAIKVSKESFSERFDREARAVATLNHPHICTLFDVGPDYLVMEYVDGSPLQGPLPLDRALTYGAQICEALDAAHRKGITHRDLKPSNILVTKAGVKLLDFGLAKIEPAVAANEAAMTRAVTQQGQILGTLHYMSPEQLQGQETGPASDIFSFGLVLYEMVTGRRAFDGSSPASVIAAILERPAPSIADTAPPALDRTLRRCLEKDPEHRWQSASDLKAELQWIASGGGALAPVPSASRSPRWPWAIAAALAVALGVALWAPWRTDRATRYTFSIHPIQGNRFSGGPMISPDGSKIAILSDGGAAKRRLEIHRLDSGTSQEIPGVQAATVSWSPDGRYLVFVDQLELKRVDVTGGPPIKIADFPAGNLAPFTAWSRENVILYTGRDGLYAVPASGGQSRRVTTSAMSTGPQFLPDNRHFLYWSNSRPAQTQHGTVYAGSLDLPPDQNNVVVLNDTSGAMFAHDAGGSEYLLFVRDDTLMAQAFDAVALKTTGEPFVVSPQIGTMGPVPGVSVSLSGVLALTPDATGGRSITQLAWFDRSGKRLADAGPQGFYREFSLSPDETQVAVAITDRDDTDIFLLNVKSASSRPARFTFDRAPERSPLWSPDGSRVVYSKGALFEKPVIGAGAERLLTKPGQSPTDWSRDGRTIVYSLNGDIMLLKDGKPSQFSKTDFVEQFPHLSPDGSLIAYTSNDSSHVFDVWVETVPAGNKWQPSPDGGFQPRWRGDGRELFYIRYSDAKLMAVPSTPAPNISFGAPVELFAVPTVGLERGYGVTSDGKRFLVPTIAPGPSTPITVMTNWTAN